MGSSPTFVGFFFACVRYFIVVNYEGRPSQSPLAQVDKSWLYAVNAYLTMLRRFTNSMSNLAKEITRACTQT